MGVRILLFVKGDGIGEEERYSLTSEIVRDRDTHTERWVVEVDMESRTPAEPFELYRYHDRQFPTDDFFAPVGPNSEDVLWAKPTDEPHDIYGNGRMVWNSKTQGRPYHYAMLAVGMLVESRCPGCAYVTGDIDLSQAEEVRQWATPLLEEPLALPVCVDPDRLYERLSAIYEEEEHVVSRATGLFLGSDTELHRALIRHAGRATADAWFKERLGDFDSLFFVGASELVRSFLEATGDVPGLVEIIQEIASAQAGETDEGAGFSLNGLLHELCSRFITISPDERSVLETHGVAAATATAAALKTSDEVIYDAFLKIARTPSPVPVYVPADELLELFSQADLEQRDQFAETIRAEVARQTVHYEAEEDSARELGEMIRRKLMSAPVITTPQTRSDLLAELYRVTRIHGIALTETAWNRIDALRDEAMLKHLLALAAIKYDEIHFCEGRLHVLESARLWPVLAGAA